MKFAVIVARPSLFSKVKKTSLFIHYFEHAVTAYDYAAERRKDAAKDNRWPMLACKIIGIKPIRA